MFRLGDLQTKTLLSIMRDCPARVGDLVERVIPRIKENEFLIESEKENVVGKVYISQETQDLYGQLEKASLTLPTTKRGISKMLERICKVCGLPAYNPHILRKVFFTTASNLNINRDILRVLMFKSIAKDVLTYLLNREELGQAWQQIINAIPLEKPTGKADSNIDDIARALARLIKKEMTYPTVGLGLLVEEPPMETIRRFLES
jgi:hypothetical protein